MFCLLCFASCFLLLAVLACLACFLLCLLCLLCLLALLALLALLLASCFACFASCFLLPPCFACFASCFLLKNAPKPQHSCQKPPAHTSPHDHFPFPDSTKENYDNYVCLLSFETTEQRKPTEQSFERCTRTVTNIWSNWQELNKHLKGAHLR